jgi:hypothetical protein
MTVGEHLQQMVRCRHDEAQWSRAVYELGYMVRSTTGYACRDCATVIQWAARRD